MELRSNIEINKKMLKVGTEIYYCDCENYMSYTKQISFRNMEFLRNDRNIIQTKVLDNIDLIIEKINKEL